MWLSRKKMVFHRVKIRIEVANIAKVQKERIRKRRSEGLQYQPHCQRPLALRWQGARGLSERYLWSPPEGTPRRVVDMPYFRFLFLEGIVEGSVDE